MPLHGGGGYGGAGIVVANIFTVNTPDYIQVAAFSGRGQGITNRLRSHALVQNRFYNGKVTHTRRMRQGLLGRHRQAGAD